MPCARSSTWSPAVASHPEERDRELTALRKTFLPFAATTGVFALAGWLLRRAAPAALTLSEALLRAIRRR
jgi:hypothetical protein